jgi:hypothetical protein
MVMGYKHSSIRVSPAPTTVYKHASGLQVCNTWWLLTQSVSQLAITIY